MGQQGVKVGSERHGEPSAMGSDERKGSSPMSHPGAWQTSSKEFCHHGEATRAVCSQPNAFSVQREEEVHARLIHVFTWRKKGHIQAVLVCLAWPTPGPHLTPNTTSPALSYICPHLTPEQHRMKCPPATAASV